MGMCTLHRDDPKRDCTLHLQLCFYARYMGKLIFLNPPKMYMGTFNYNKRYFENIIHTLENHDTTRRM